MQGFGGSFLQFRFRKATRISELKCYILSPSAHSIAWSCIPHNSCELVLSKTVPASMPTSLSWCVWVSEAICPCIGTFRYIHTRTHAHFTFAYTHVYTHTLSLSLSLSLSLWGFPSSSRAIQDASPGFTEECSYSVWPRHRSSLAVEVQSTQAPV